MDAPSVAHPSHDTLLSYGLGKLDDTIAESVNKHLEQCVPLPAAGGRVVVGRFRRPITRCTGGQPEDASARPKTIVDGSIRRDRRTLPQRGRGRPGSPSAGSPPPGPGRPSAVRNDPRSWAAAAWGSFIWPATS